MVGFFDFFSSFFCLVVLCWPFLVIVVVGGDSWQFFCVSFPLGGCFLWLLLMVSLVVVEVAGWWCSGGKVVGFMWLFLLWFSGFGGGGDRHGLMGDFSSIFCFGIVVVICWGA